MEAGMFEVLENVALASYTTAARTEQEVAAAVGWARERGVALFVLGGGSNLLVRDTGFAGLVLRVEVLGLSSWEEGCLDVGAGEIWDGFVDRAIALGLAGVECLAGIPGSVGGTPVQNVGAYGQEVSETIESVRAFDRANGAWVELGKADCRFRYRESLFNTDEPGRYIVTSVRFRLRLGGAPALKYADLRKKFAEGAKPTLAEVAAAVRQIRRSKGMLLVEGDADCRSAGSFFKNPIVAVEVVDRVAAGAGVEAAAVPHWPAGEGKVKLPAAWLLEKAGFVKGYGVGSVGISTRHTLALTNRGGATFEDVERLQADIEGMVERKFGVRLVREPVVLG
jgi:UDP-N-acetylmuramate dehydrogenase